MPLHTLFQIPTSRAVVQAIYESAASNRALLNLATASRQPRQQRGPQIVDASACLPALIEKRRHNTFE
ncbi:MAG: hypothetical protein ABSG53_09850 [Thermoguttaceae bacterium]